MPLFRSKFPLSFLSSLSNDATSVAFFFAFAISFSFLFSSALAFLSIAIRSASASLRALSAALDYGFTYFDTAPAYGNGLSETLLSKVLSPVRDKVIIATKCGLEWGEDVIYAQIGKEVKIFYES